MKKVLECEDLVKEIRKFDQHTCWNQKEVFDRIIREINVKTSMYEKLSDACLKAIDDKINELENDSKGINSVYVGNIDTHIGFVLKYLNKPHIYHLECIKRKQLALWD